MSSAVTTQAPELLNYVNGAWRRSAATEFADVSNPATAELLARTPLSTSADVDAAVHAAADAFPAWRRTPPGERVQYLKVRIVLEVKEEKQVEAIKPTLPRVTDIFQTYLRELRPSDLNGSVGLFRLKEELTRRVNAVISPSQVNAVLFKEIVVQ